jgi:hypothetical protein
VRTVGEAGWSGTRNGALLRKAAGEFEVFLTVDANIEHQQDTTRLPIAVVVLVAYSNDIAVLRPLMPQVCDLLPEVERGRLYHVRAST